MPTGCWCVGVWCVVVLLCCCVVVLLCCCVGLWLLCSASMHGASTQPRLKVLPHAYRVLVCCCVVVLLCCCVVVLVCGCCVLLVCAGLVGGCVGVLWCCGVGCIVLCDASVCRVSTQPKLTVLSRAYWVLVCWCMVVV